jgi:chromosome segregation ATPase
MMRKVEDDIISQMALLQNLKASLSESTGASDDAQSIAVELVTLMQRVEELEQNLIDCEGDVTEAQAREAVIEADRNQVQVLLTKTTEALEKEQESVNKLQKRFDEISFDNKKKQEQINELTKDLQELGSALVDLKNKPFVDENLAAQLMSKDALLEKCRESLEDWSIVSKITLEQLGTQFQSWDKLSMLVNNTKFTEVSFKDLIQTDPDTFSSEIESFLESMNFLIKQTYTKIALVSQQGASTIVTVLQERYKAMEYELTRKISFSS